MTSVRLQDPSPLYKSQYYFYILAKNNWNLKFGRGKVLQQLKEKCRLYRCKSKQKYVQDQYAENYKRLMNGTKGGLNKWRDTPCSWIGKLSFAKMSVFLKQTLNFVIKIQSSGQCGIGKMTCTWMNETVESLDIDPNKQGPLIFFFTTRQRKVIQQMILE